VRESPGPTSKVSAQALSADGRLLVAGLLDTTGLIWDVSDWLKPPPLGDGAREPIEGSWQALAGEDAGKAHTAMAALIAAPEATVAHFRSHLKASAPVDLARIAQLVKQLDHRRFQKRQDAEEELQRLGSVAEAALQRALANTTAIDLRRRIERLLANLSLTPLSPEEVRGVRAVEVLEQIGGPEVRRLLEQLSAGPADLLLTREAKASLQRLAARPLFAGFNKDRRDERDPRGDHGADALSFWAVLG
jgi:hypothetical protein